MTDDGFTADEARMLPGLLDVVIPASDDGRLPAAGALDLGPHLVRAVARMPLLRGVVEYGLATLAGLARARHPDGWDALDPAARTAVFAEFTAGDELFLPAFLFAVYSGYYAHPRVVAALGFEARAPHPDGYVVARDDDLPALLERVRRRGPTYRE